MTIDQRIKVLSKITAERPLKTTSLRTGSTRELHVCIDLQSRQAKSDGAANGVQVYALAALENDKGAATHH